MPRDTSIERNLCDLAVNGRKTYPTVCQHCESPCVYGKQWLKKLGLPLPKETHENLYPKDTPTLSTKPRQILKRNYLNRFATK